MSIPKSANTPLPVTPYDAQTAERAAHLQKIANAVAPVEYANGDPSHVATEATALQNANTRGQQAPESGQEIISRRNGGV